ncbi:hypothetical protein KC957_02760 [Candidatus Saccharibacteria bacterium]|nr:hypothetical protein [Candidatus Saccharibacteria bacterium]
MSEQPHNPAEHNGMGRRIAAGALTGALIAGAMVGVKHETHTEQQNVPYLVDTYAEQEVLDPGKTLVVEVGADGLVKNQYQEDFQTDAEDARESSDQVAPALEDLLGEEGWSQVYDIKIEGLASAEDDSNAPDAGVLTPDVAEPGKPDNTNLALQRALLTARPVIDTFAKHGVDVSKPVEKEEGQDPTSILADHDVTGVEDEWAADDYAEAEQLASQFGYETVNDMITRYNDDEAAAPSDVQEFLKPLLDDERGATITISLRDGATHTILVKDGGKKVVYDKSSRTVTEVEPTVNPTVGVIPEQVVGTVVKPWERVRKDDAYRRQQRAPQGNGQRPTIHRGRVHQGNPTPSNFAR